MAPPDRKILLPKLAAEAPGEIDQVLPATTKRKALPPRRRNAPVAYQTCQRRKVKPWWAYFDTDLFLYELANAETNFCSSILVNALLAWATVSLRNCQVYVHQTVITKLASQQSYAHYEPMATTLPTKFLDEALWIYDDEKSVDCLTTVAATSLMNMTFTTLGKDKAGRRLQEDNARMAQRM
nr:hypothetical protein FVER53263_20460 [Fusarium verticillioides]